VFVTTPLRTLAGAAALVAGLWLLSGAGAAPPALPQGAYQKAAEADLAFLQKRVEELAAAPGGPKDAQRKPAITAAMTLAAYAEALGDPALKENALKVADALIKKDIAGAGAVAKTLTVKPGGTPGKGDLPTLKGFDVELAMTAFRPSKTGGMNIEKDLKDMITMKEPKPVVPAEVEVLVTRSALMMAYAAGLDYEGTYPSGLPVNAQNKELWRKMMNESVDLTKQIAEEAGKPRADEKEIVKLLKALDAKCYDCHNKFRFEP
jgi:hypothetical protein